MKVVPLGISSGVPTETRNVSAVAVVLARGWVLLDCGEGTQQRIHQAGLKKSRLDSIFITHLHGDHVYGLPGLIGTMSMQGRAEPLHVHGPPGIRELLSTALRISEAHLSYPLLVAESEGRAVVRDTPRYRVTCAPLDHRVLALGYRLEEKVRHGATIAYCTDTRRSAGAVELARGADLLIHECTYSADLGSLASERGHSTAADAALVASAARAKRLLLTHFSPRYRDVSSLVDEARVTFAESYAAEELVAVEVTNPVVEIRKENGARGRT